MIPTNSSGSTCTDDYRPYHYHQQHHQQRTHGIQQPSAAAPPPAGNHNNSSIVDHNQQHYHTLGQRLTWRWVPTLEPNTLSPGTASAAVGTAAAAAATGAPSAMTAMTDLYSSPMIPHRGAAAAGHPFYAAAAAQHHLMPPYFHYGGAPGILSGGTTTTTRPTFYLPESPYETTALHHQHHSAYHQFGGPSYYQLPPPPGVVNFPPGTKDSNTATTGSGDAAPSSSPATGRAALSTNGTVSESSSPVIPASVTAGTEAETEIESPTMSPSSKNNKKKRESSSSSSSPSKSLKKPKMGERRSTEDLDAATLLASMMKSDQQSNASDSDDGGTEGGGAEKDSSTAPDVGKGANGGKATVYNKGRTDDGSITPTLASDIKWYHGVVSLHLPEDDDTLSPLHCFMRRYCVEAFSATPDDVSTPRYGKSHGFKVEVGQVGLRCLYCKHLPISKRPERAVCYPSSLRNIYHSIETWQRRHAEKCSHITPWVRKSIQELMETSKTRAGGRRQYWEDSARRLGMADTSYGVRFVRPPSDLGPEISPTKKAETELLSDAKPVVREEDKDLVTEYLFLLMEQMQTCKFTEEDRTGGRSKIKDNEVGFPGMECKHCHGRAGFGRYFPTSVAALSLANSDRNVFNHLQKCRRCPEPVKSELVRLLKDQGQGKNRRGLRKLFFKKIWDRIHGETNEKKDLKQPPEPPQFSGKSEDGESMYPPPQPPASTIHHGHHMSLTGALPPGAMQMHPMAAGISMAFAAVPVTLPVVPNHHHMLPPVTAPTSAISFHQQAQV